MDDKRLIVDIETMGTTPNSVVLQVALQAWDDNINTQPTAHVWNLDAKAQERLGRTISYDTVLWWQNQSKDAVNAVFGASKAIVLTRFIMEFAATLEGYIEQGYREVWANAPSFDLVIIEDLLRGKCELPWKFYHWRDQRTLEATYQALFRRKAKDVFAAHVAQVEGLPHTADYDVRKQAVLISQMVQAIKGLNQLELPL